MDSLCYPTARERVTDNVPIKRPPEDDEEELYELHMAPNKRQAVEDPAYPAFPAYPAYERQPASSRSSSDVAVQGLRGKAPGELVSIILQMQSSHEQVVAELRSRYVVVSRQLEKLTKILNNHFTSQLTAIQSVQQDIVSISPPQKHSRPTVPTAVTSNANGTNAQPPSLIPGLVAATPRPQGGVTIPVPRQNHFETPSYTAFSPSHTPTTTSPGDMHDKVEIKITPSPHPYQPPTVVPSKLDSVADVWEEYRYGRNGNPSLESIEVRWGPRWRKDYKVQAWYNKRKIITDKIKQYIADGVDEEAAVRELHMMRRNRTLNWLSRELESHRKETKKKWKAAREAALANKEAMLGSVAVPGKLG